MALYGKPISAHDDSSPIKQCVPQYLCKYRLYLHIIFGTK